MLQTVRQRVIIKTKTVDKLWICMVFAVLLKSIFFLGVLASQKYAGLNIADLYLVIPVLVTHAMFVVVIFSFALLFGGRKRFIYYGIVDLFVSILLVADIWYYRSNANFLSIQYIFSPELFNQTGSGIVRFRPIDLIFFIDFPILVLAGKWVYMTRNSVKSLRAFLLVFLVSALYIRAAHYLIDEKDITKGSMMLFRVCWEPFETMCDLSPLGYHGYDIYNMFTANKRIKLSDIDKKEISKWFKDNKEPLPDNEYKGALKGKNLIAIQVESLENFVIGKKVYNQEITPNLNKLLENSLYFDNIHEQNNGGTSSDADLMVNTSILPVREGMTFFRFPLTAYNSLPKLLGDMGYDTISTHGEFGGNYNWQEVHKAALGFKTSLAIADYKQDEIIRSALSDRSLFEQFEPHLKEVKQPFYSYIVTVTSHGPFDMEDKDKYLKLPDELDATLLGQYFQSIRYVDEKISEFLSKLQKDGLLENSVIMIYGDHTGVHKYYMDKIKDIQLEGDWWKIDDKEIPLIIYNPEIKGTTIDTIGGHIDIMPTISYMMGIDEEKFADTSMGKILVKTNRNFTVLNYGDIIGTPNNEDEKQHMLSAREIADKIIRSDYFKR